MGALQDDVVTLAKGANFAALSVLLPDGTPMTHMMWVDADDSGDHLLLNTEVHRAKMKAIERNPRVAIAVIDGENPYHYAEVRGTVVGTVGGKEARDHIDALSQKYMGRPYPPEMIQTERVILRVRPDRQRVGA